MRRYDAIVIGAGNAGLAAGAVLARSGMKTAVIEKHNIPGGCATSFKRGAFEFEVALHQLSGVGSPLKPGPLRPVLDACGVLDKVKFVEMKNLYKIIIPGKLELTIPADKDKAIAALCGEFPDEAGGIKDFFDLVYKFFVQIIGAYYLKDPEMSREKYPLFYEYSLKNSMEILDRYFKNPLLKMTIASYWSYMGVPPSLLSFTDLASLLYSYIEWKPYYIKGGSQALSNAFADTIIAAGGDIIYNCEVAKISADKKGVKGVVLKNGEFIGTDYVVSNASTYVTYVDLLEDAPVPEAEYEKLKGGMPGVSALTLHIGLNASPAELGISETTNFICAGGDVEEGFRQCRRVEVEDDFMLLTCYNVSDIDAAPSGKSQVSIVTLKYGEPWLSIPPERYAETKFRCADKIISNVEKVFPGFRDKIEEIEVATPLTYMRYLGHPEGAIYGTDQYMKDSPYFISPRSSVKGLYLAGSWAGPGGFQPTITGGASAGRSVIKDFTSREDRI